jgi:hypothetical protein
VVRFGIDFCKYPIDQSREMGLDEFELASDQRILGQRHEELNRGRRALPAGRAVTLAPLATHGNLFQHPSNVVVQVAHRRLLLRGSGEEASGSAFMPAICWRTAAKFSSDGSSTGATSFTGLPWWRLIGFLRMIRFLSSARVKIVVERLFLLPWCQTSPVSVTARLRAP